MEANSSIAPLRFDHFELDESDARLTRAGKPVSLAPKPFAVLCALARAPGRLVTKDALLDIVWGHRFVTPSALKTAISELRAALNDDPRQPRYIETVSCRGYRFIALAASLPMQGGVVGREDPDNAGNAGQAALTALCRGDAALADLIRTVAATLARERRVLSEA